MRNGKGAETLTLLMESLGDKFSHVVIKECSHHLVVGSFFLSLNIYYAKYCASTGDTYGDCSSPCPQGHWDVDGGSDNKPA